MNVIKVQQQKQGYKVTTEDKKEYSISYIKGTFLYKETKAFIDGGGTIETEFTDTEIEKQNKDKKINKLETIFNQKTIDIKAIACDKTGSNEYIKTQFEVYENMYQNAKAGLYETAVNDAIITANETAKSVVAPLTLTINEIRHHFQRLIEASVDVDAEFETFDALVLDINDDSELVALLANIQGK